MKLKFLPFVATFVFLALQSALAFAADPYPLEYFALREALSNVEVSPDGKHLAMLKILTREGNPILHVYDAADLSKKPFVVDSDPMEIRSFNWVGDNVIVLSLRQKVRNNIDGQNQGVYETRLQILDLDKKAFKNIEAPYPAIENLLPHDKNKIIISMQPGAEEDLSLPEAFRPRAYYKLDLKRGTKELLIRGKLDLGQIDFDADGDPWFARGFDASKQDYIWYNRPKGESGWHEFYRQSEDSFDDYTVYGPDDAIPGNVIVGANNGNDIEGLWTYNTAGRKFGELLYRRSDVDIYGVRYHSNNWTYPDRIVGVRWAKDKIHTEYFDEIEGATYKQLEGLIPNSYYVSITSRSRDGKALTARNVGPHDPGTYYLYKDGKFERIGSTNPLVDPADLADVKYIEYKARDGRQIGGYLTVPHGKPPFPLIVLPHGGPFVGEVVMYDEWGQMLANNGYMVLQPEYRGTKGYGLEFYESAWKNGSQAGYKMQDDKDDGALYLVGQGLVDKDRIAMFGWSYGGYAALVAAARTPQIYQCVIAAAAVSDMVKQVNNYLNMRGFRGAPKIEQLAYRNGAINPVDEADKVNVPILLIHGSVDQRVQLVQAKLYMSSLEKAGKPYKFVELEGADHFYDTLFYKHKIKLYTSMIDFLKNDCGPGGL